MDSPQIVCFCFVVQYLQVKEDNQEIASMERKYVHVTMSLSCNLLLVFGSLLLEIMYCEAH